MDSKSTTPTAMGTTTGRSKPALHNFTMPADLRWGNQRFLRCMKVNNSNGSSNSNSDRSPDGGEGIAAVREKLMIDLQTAADKMKDAIFKEGQQQVVEEGEICVDRPWNLRTRRAALRNSDGGGGKDLNSLAAAVVVEKSPSRLRNGGGGGAAERPKFSVALSKKEIEEDFLKMVGHRPPRRPKRRPRNVQKQLDTLFPGLWLTEVTPDMYKVTEPAPSQRN